MIKQFQAVAEVQIIQTSFPPPRARGGGTRRGLNGLNDWNGLNVFVSAQEDTHDHQRFK